jgi:hypothetical protein
LLKTVAADVKELKKSVEGLVADVKTMKENIRDLRIQSVKVRSSSC